MYRSRTKSKSRSRSPRRRRYIAKFQHFCIVDLVDIKFEREGGQHATCNDATVKKVLLQWTIQGVSWKTKVKSVFGKLGKCCFYLQYFLYNIDNHESKQKYTQSHSSYKIETSHF